MRITAETKQATRQRILEVAKKLFKEQGFEATTTRDIARDAAIAVGTLFNYFPTKEAIVASLIGDALDAVANDDKSAATAGGPPSDSQPAATMEEELFAEVASILRALKPFRKYLPAVLDTALSPVHSAADSDILRTAHLESVARIVSRHGHHESLTPVSMQLYWTLYTGLLAFWSQDRSPRQEDTLALLDHSIAMFVGWLVTLPTSGSVSAKKEG